VEPLAPEDLYSLEDYAKLRSAFRSRVMEHKNHRRLQLGDHLALLFEDRLTMQYQVQEMLRAEKIFEARDIRAELDTYNPLIPDGSNWKATLMIEYPDAGARTTPSCDTGLEELRARLKVKSDDTHYYCQSTELSKATEAFPGRHKFWWVRIPFREIRNGDRSVSELLKLFVLKYWQRLRLAVNSETLRGPHKRAPSESLDLQPDDLVRVKSRVEIVQTMDHNERNRGLSLSHEMMRCCRAVAEVRYRVDRLID
jgi:hypothetical protein